MMWREFERGCATVIALSHKYPGNGNIVLPAPERKQIKPFVEALKRAHEGGDKLPKKNGRPFKGRPQPLGVRYLRGWQVYQFADASLIGSSISRELLYSVALACRAARNGVDPNKAFKVTETDREQRGLKPLGLRKNSLLHELDIGRAVARAVSVQKQKKVSDPKTQAYLDVAKKYSLSPETVARYYTRCLSRVPEEKIVDKEAWLKRKI